MHISSSTPLAGNGTYTDTRLADRQDYIVGTILADQSGTLVLSQSGDGTNFDVSKSYTVVANTPQTINETVIHPWIKVLYTNGASAQGTFRLFVRASSAGDS